MIIKKSIPFFKYIVVSTTLSMSLVPLYASQTQYENLFEAAQLGSSIATQNLIERGHDVNANYMGDLTALIMAACHGHLEVAQILLKNGANPNPTRKNVKTALVVAATFNHSKIAQLLIENGAELDSIEKGGYTALMMAAYYKHSEVVRLLTQRGATPPKKAIFSRLRRNTQEIIAQFHPIYYARLMDVKGTLSEHGLPPELQNLIVIDMLIPENNTIKKEEIRRQAIFLEQVKLYQAKQEDETSSRKKRIRSKDLDETLIEREASKTTKIQKRAEREQ